MIEKMKNKFLKKYRKRIIEKKLVQINFFLI